MELLLGGLLLAGVCRLADATDIPTMRNFNAQRIARTWYPLALIPTGPPGPSGPVSRADFPPLTFMLLPNGNLKYRIRVLVNGVCSNKDMLMIKEGQPGYYLNIAAQSSIRFVDTDYNNYLIVHITLGSDAFLALSGSQPRYTLALKQKFKAVALSLGITPEIILGSAPAAC